MAVISKYLEKSRWGAGGYGYHPEMAGRLTNNNYMREIYYVCDCIDGIMYNSPGLI